MTALLVWLACLACAALWYVLTGAAAALAVGAALAVTALCGSVLALLARRRVAVVLEVPQTGIQHRPCTLTVRAENASGLPLPCIRVWLRVENLLTGQTAAAALALSAPPKRGGESAVTLEDPLCGLYRLSVEKARVYRQPAHRCGAAAGDFHRRQDMDGGQSDYHRQDRHCQVERPQNRCTVPCDGDQGPSRLHAADRAAVHRDAGQR